MGSKMRVVPGVCLSMAMLACIAQSQTLQQRKPSPAGATVDEPSASTTPDNAQAALPAAAEGEYRWGETGEVIELYAENGALRGYMTRRSERHVAGSAPITFAFSKAQIKDGAVSFTTRSIHGDWYSFTGRIVRGPSARPHQDGAFLLQGTLTTHLGPESPDDPASSDQPLTRQVSLKLSASSHPAK